VSARVTRKLSKIKPSSQNETFAGNPGVFLSSLKMINYKKVLLISQTPDFYDILNVVGETFGTYRGEMRAPLHITLLNIEKVPFEPLEKLWRTIVKNEYYFGNYDFQLYAKGGKHCVNVGRVAISG
jgi:hypothetical protein